MIERLKCVVSILFDIHVYIRQLLPISWKIFKTNVLYVFRNQSLKSFQKRHFWLGTRVFLVHKIRTRTKNNLNLGLIHLFYRGLWIENGESCGRSIRSSMKVQGLEVLPWKLETNCLEGARSCLNLALCQKLCCKWQSYLHIDILCTYAVYKGLFPTSWWWYMKWLVEPSNILRPHEVTQHVFDSPDRAMVPHCCWEFPFVNTARCRCGVRQTKRSMGDHGKRRAHWFKLHLKCLEICLEMLGRL